MKSKDKNIYQKYIIGNLIINKTFYFSVKILNYLHLYIQGGNMQKKSLLVMNTLSSKGMSKKGYPGKKKAYIS